MTLSEPTQDLADESMVSSISVIFPAYNEQLNIRKTVEQARAVLPEIAHRWEIIVVNDGSSDATAEICDELAEEDSRIIAVHHQGNKGYGAALKSGIMAARNALVFFSDADGQFDLYELQEVVRYANDFDIVAGYRGKRRDPLPRLINAWGWNTLVRCLLGVRVRDIDCAFKLFRRQVFEQVQIRAVGAMVNTEILAQAKHFGMSIHEVKVTHFPRIHGKPTGANFGVILKAFRELFHLWWKLRAIDQDQAGLYERPATAPVPELRTHALAAK
ncbi:MAG: glycosyltransferase family 2 protein [Verrucomicrobia bacterium]|nr:glycosyltransferase family 2 protein [Verrucomicrobiota bacterium]MBV9659400.1 glycosyltransferase family 2 protein [Verrucomicrobiota bacterium]